MKALNTVLLISLFIFPGGLPLAAQDINYERMDRDIRIMENVLSEMLKTSVKGQNGSTVNFGPMNNNVQGTYIPGYGVILSYEPGISYMIRTTSENGEEAGSFTYSFSGNRDVVTVNKETLKERITEFLKDYAPTIGQLDEDENIMVIYRRNASQPYAMARVIVNGRLNDDVELEEIPTISVNTKKSDLNAYKQGKLSDEALMQRISVSESEDQEYLDLKILSNILKTALSDTGVNSYGIRGAVSYTLLDNFGALYNMDVRYGYGNNRFGAITIRDERVREALRETMVEGFRVSSKEEADEAREERAENQRKALEELKSALREYLIDYGSTLNSVKNDQFVMLSVNLDQSYLGKDEFPSRLVIQVSKSILDRADSGSISRNDAMEEVQIMEY